MGAVAEDDVLRGRVSELVLQAPPTLDSPHACVAERVELVRVLACDEGDRERRVELCVRLVPGGQEERAEHVLVGLVVARAEDELGVGVGVQDALDDLALVDGERADLEVLLADENCTARESQRGFSDVLLQQLTFDGTLAREVVLEQVLALVALKKAARTSAHAAALHSRQGSPPLRVR